MVSCKWVKIQSRRRREYLHGPVGNVTTLLAIPLKTLTHRVKEMEGGNMDNGKGRMIPLRALDDIKEVYKKNPNAKGIFTVGEELEISP